MVAAVTEALEELRRRNLLGYSEKHGYKVQSSAGEEWERERRDIGVPSEAIGDVVQDALSYLLAEPDRPRLSGRPFPWAAVFTDGRKADDVTLVDPRDDAVIRVDFRFLSRVHLDLRNRELKSEADVDALVEEIKKRLMEQIRAGARVRLL